jgi:rubredoxin
MNVAFVGMCMIRPRETRQATSPPDTAFENLPGNWVCPVCGASKDQFVPVA